jgi:hypothetical protein
MIHPAARMTVVFHEERRGKEKLARKKTVAAIHTMKASRRICFWTNCFLKVRISERLAPTGLGVSLIRNTCKLEKENDMGIPFVLAST